VNAEIAIELLSDIQAELKDKYRAEINDLINWIKEEL